jgi:hypothetical protein
MTSRHEGGESEGHRAAPPGGEMVTVYVMLLVQLRIADKEKDCLSDFIKRIKNEDPELFSILKNTEGETWH